MLAALVVFLAGFGLGTRFTVFSLVPVGVVVTLFCIILGFRQQAAIALAMWAGLIVAVNLGFLVGRLVRSLAKGSLAG